VLLNGMDIYAGSAICIGRNNFFTKFYNSSPIGITVEGSNVLTRSLIIFGQGLNKSHPYIFNIFDSIQSNNLETFKTNFKSMLNFSIKLYFKSLVSNNRNRRLDNIAIKYANLANFVALLGGKIKSEQMISGHMADILSNIYLAQSLIWYHNNIADKCPNLIRDYCIDRLCREAEEKINIVINNYPDTYIRTLLKPTTCAITYSNFKHENMIFQKIMSDTNISELLKENIFYEDTVIEDLEKLTALKNSKDTSRYKELYKSVINVGENDITKHIN
jgi:acyl-CoA dehydrogenase